MRFGICLGYDSCQGLEGLCASIIRYFAQVYLCMCHSRILICDHHLRGAFFTVDVNQVTVLDY